MTSAARTTRARALSTLHVRGPIAAVAVVLAVALPALGARVAWASPDQTVYFEAPRDLLSAGARPAAMDSLASLGVRALRVTLFWKSVAPAPNSKRRPVFDATDPAAYDWRQYDAAIAAAQEREWDVLLTVSGPVPKWATGTRRDNVTRPSAMEFGLFMTAIGRHYGTQVKTFSIWNEPNHPAFLGPQYLNGRPASPRIYRGLFQAGVAGLHAAGLPNAKVLMGETAPRGTRRDVAPLAFLRGALCLDGSYRLASTCSPLPADGYAHHAYTTLAGPYFRPANGDDVTIGVLGRLETALDRAYAAGAVPSKLPVYLTEFGVQSKPNPFLGVPVAQQAEFQETAERIAWSDPRVAAFSQYLLRDDSQLSRPGGAAVGFQSGLRYANGRDKPSYAGFRLPLSAHRERRNRVGLWGLVRPARGVTSVQVMVLDRRRRTRALATVTTDVYGHFTLRVGNRSGRRWRLRWTSPSGQIFTGPPIRAY